MSRMVSMMLMLILLMNDVVERPEVARLSTQGQGDDDEYHEIDDGH
jgi:hypothetical protein